MNIDFDSFDIILTVAVIGGFMTDNWLPALALGVIAFIGATAD